MVQSALPQTPLPLSVPLAGPPVFLASPQGATSTSGLLTTGALSAIPSNLGNSTFSLNKTSGSISIGSDIDFSSATIILNASDTTSGNGNITGANNITAGTLTLTAAGALTGTNALTAVNRINLNAAFSTSGTVTLTTTCPTATCPDGAGIYINGDTSNIMGEQQT